MSSLDEFRKIVTLFEEKFQLVATSLHEHVMLLTLPDKITEVCRVVFHVADGLLGISFHVEAIPTDAIQLFNEASNVVPEVVLFNTYFRDAKGNFFSGHDAVVMAEHDRQQKTELALAEKAKIKQAEEWEMKKIREGKITFH